MKEDENERMKHQVILLMINDKANKKATKNLSGLNSLGWLRGKKRSNNS